MIRKRKQLFYGVLAVFVVLAAGAPWAGAKEGVPRMTQEQLKEMLGKPDVIILDVRSAGDWKKAQMKIQGAVREDPDKAAKAWAGKYGRDKTIVLYCA